MSSKKTYHKLSLEPDAVAVQYCWWDAEGDLLHATNITGTVSTITMRIVAIRLLGPAGPVVRFSRRSGAEWGSYGSEAYRIHAKHAEVSQ